MSIFLQSKPGFALNRQDDKTVLSLVNLVHPCGVSHDEQAMDCPDERILQSFESAWIEKVQVLLKHLLSFDSIRDKDTLEGICRGYLKGLTPIDEINPRFVECVN